MFAHEVGKRHPVLREIDLVLAQAMAAEWSGIEIAVRWPRYEVIVLHRLKRQVDKDQCLAFPDRRPLKAYRGYSLILMPADARAQERISGYIKCDSQWIDLEPYAPGPEQY